MDAKLTAGVDIPRRGSVERADAVAALILVSGAAVAALAVLVFVRRVSGALEHPAPAAALIASAIAVGTYAFLSRYFWPAIDRPQGAHREVLRWDAVTAWAPSVAIVLLTFGTSWPFERFIDWLVWMPLWIAEFFWRTTSGKVFLDAVASKRRTGSESRERNAVTVNDMLDKAVSQPVTTQELTRFRGSDGEESIVGTMRADFSPGQRTTEVYVGFCPPFDGIPLVQVEQSAGPPARLTVAQVAPHGARVQLKLQEQDSRADAVLLDLYVCGPR